MTKRFDRINIEITNVCNLQCSFCPEVVREKKIMGIALFRKIIAEVAPLTREVCFHLMGEPLGHSKLGDFLDICAEYQVPVNLTSNGILLNAARKELVLKPVVRQINFSLHSFESNFGDRDMGPYLEKIFSFTEEAFVRRPDLYINYRLWNLMDPVSQTAKNLEIFSQIEKRFKVDLREKLQGETDVRQRKSKRVINRLYLHFDSRFEWPHPSHSIRSEIGYCHGLSGHFGIHADGTVVPCCLDKEAVIDLGNCGDRSVSEILTSPRAVAMAEGFKKNQLVEDLCRKCSYISRFDSRSRKAAGSPDQVSTSL